MYRTLDLQIWKTGNSFVVTIPKKTIRKYKLRNGGIIEVRLKLEDKK